jgi:hypothetical protein
MQELVRSCCAQRRPNCANLCGRPPDRSGHGRRSTASTDCRGELARREGGRAATLRATLDDLAGHGAILLDADRHQFHRVSTDLLNLIGRLAAAAWSDGFARGERQIRTIGEGWKRR